MNQIRKTTLKLINYFFKILNFAENRLSTKFSDFIKISVLKTFYKQIKSVETIKYIFDLNGEPYARNDQLKSLKEYAAKKYNILEIGFNFGHSSENFLKHSNANVLSLDIGIHKYCKFSEIYLKKKYPSRFNILYGDSKKTVPELAKSNNFYDLIFIDGGHSYEDAYQDIVNSKKISNKKTLIIVDDIEKTLNQQFEHNIGPTNAWNKLVEMKFINETDYIKFAPSRGMTLGEYNFDFDESKIIL